jgi:cell division protein FtsI/penicillin-binding protein 2
LGNHLGRAARSVRPIVLLGILSLSLAPTLPLQAAQGLQPFVNSLLRGRRGAIIVSNPMTGEVLAVGNPEAAFGRVFPPGSTAKIVEGAVALQEGLISPSDRILCRRVPELLGEAYRCSHPPAVEPFALAPALANSCNYFFAALSTRLTATSLAHGYAMFGFGSPAEGLGVESSPGQVRIGDGAAAKARAALGEGTVWVTPAQLLLAYSAIGTRGAVFRLRKPSSGKNNARLLIRRVKLRSEVFAVLAEGLEECVRAGTGQGAAVEGVRVAGKTGTAAALNRPGVTHAWFVGYAPAEEPEIALVVFLERGTGARDAAPLAGKILRHYFTSKGRKP